ncbi:MAG: phosphohydrolase [Treponema sp.]
MDNLAKIDIERIKLGVRFSEPVYFDDGKSMFLAARKAVKQYHLQALKQWEIQFLLSAGTEVTLPTGVYSSLPEDDDLEEL